MKVQYRPKESKTPCDDCCHYKHEVRIENPDAYLFIPEGCMAPMKIISFDGETLDSCVDFRKTYACNQTKIKKDIQ